MIPERHHERDSENDERNRQLAIGHQRGNETRADGRERSLRAAFQAFRRAGHHKEKSRSCRQNRQPRQKAVFLFSGRTAAEEQQRGKEYRAGRHIFQIRAGIKAHEHPQNPEYRLFLRVPLKKAEIGREKRQSCKTAPTVVARPVQPEKHLAERRDEHPHGTEDHKEDEIVPLPLRLRETGKERDQRREYQSIYYIEYRLGKQEKKLHPEMGEEPPVHTVRVRRYRGEYIAYRRNALAGRKASHIRPVVHRIRRKDVSEQHEKKNSEQQRRSHSPGSDRRHGQRLLTWGFSSFYYTQAGNEVKLPYIFSKSLLTIPPGGI